MAEHGSAVEASMANVNPEAMDSVSQSSGVDPPSRSGTDLSLGSDSRRRNTERQGNMTNKEPPLSTNNA